MKHTKGPWIVKHINEPHVNVVCEKDNDWFYIACGGGNAPLEEKQANAKLIAAAPELLEALKTVLPYLKASGTNGNYWAPVVENAIKKATL